jgi:hypothetical protein
MRKEIVVEQRWNVSLHNREAYGKVKGFVNDAAASLRVN